MAYRMACRHADLIAGIASFAGMAFYDPEDCQPSQRVNVLQIHGTADINVFYGGSALFVGTPGYSFPGNMPTYPSAPGSVERWARLNGATGAVVDSAPSLDLVEDVPGLDTSITRYTSAPLGGAAELWTIVGAGHFPTLSAQFAPRLIDWLLSHPKP